MAFQFPDPNVTPEFKGANGITYSWDATDGKWVVKGFAVESVIGDCATSEDTVCDQLEQLKLGLVEVEEELESLAPALERGVWLYEQQTGNNAVLRPPNPARYFLLKGYTVGDPLLMGVEFTEEYGEADAVVFSNTEWNLEEEDGTGGSTHDWGTVEVGEIIDLFDKPDNDGLFAKITEVNDQIYGDDSILIAFNRIEFLGGPTNQEPYLTRLKIFKEPEGGDAGEFVKKRGDDMTGRLRMMRDRETVTFVPPTDIDDAHIRFKNEKANNTINTVGLFQPGPTDVIVSTNEFMSKGDFTTHEYIKACWFYTHSSGDTRRTNKQASIYFHGSATESSNSAQYGVLRFGTGDRLAWNNTGGALKYGSNKNLEWKDNQVIVNRIGTNGRNGFSIKGTQLASYGNSTGSDGDLLKVYHNAGNDADAIFYNGKITDGQHIATKKYVDDKAGGPYVKRAGNQSVTIQYSNGNFLISQA